MAHAEVTLYAWNVTKLVLGSSMLFLLIARIATTQARLRGIIATLLVAHLFLLAMNPQVILQPEVRNFILGATFLGDGNDFSLSLCIMLPLTFELAMSAQSGWRKILAWLAVVMLLFAIVASQSRGATIGMGAVLRVHVVLQYAQGRLADGHRAGRRRRLCLRAGGIFQPYQHDH